MIEENKYLINEYYSHKTFQFYILPFIRNREIAFLVHKDFKEQQKSAHRMVRMHNTQQIDFFVGNLRYPTRMIPFNWYMSVAKYKSGIPKTSFREEDSEERKKICEQWKKDHEKNIEKYDFVIDIDAPDHNSLSFALQSAIELKRKLLEEKKEFFIVFSGCGFHFHINEELENKRFNKYDEYNVYHQYFKRAVYYNEIVSELIDLNIYDSRRVIKIPYSLSIYKDRIYICKPISDTKELEEFDIKNYDFTNKKNWGFARPYTFNKKIKQNAK